MQQYSHPSNQYNHPSERPGDKGGSVPSRRRRLSKNAYLKGFAAVVVALALVRLIFPSVARPRPRQGGSSADSVQVSQRAAGDRRNEGVMGTEGREVSAATPDTARAGRVSIFFDAEGREVRHRIFSVPHFGNTFPDQQDVQLVAAERHGVEPVQDREEAERSKGRLVYVGSNPFYYIDRLSNSVPYLVPRAAVLLQDIGRAYYDSLAIKGIPLHKIIVTSVLRTKSDVERLRGHNGNATQNSCHLYGTTFDVCYNRYKTVQTASRPRRAVQNDTLKWVLSEVLRDMRERNRCCIKYEVNQGCFHITVK